MANQRYGQQQQSTAAKNMYSNSRSGIDKSYYNDSTTSSRYNNNNNNNTSSSSRYYPSSSYAADPLSLSSSDPPLFSSFTDYTPSSAFWPSYDADSSYSKRPSQALYTYSSLGAHMLGQSEAWLTSDSLAKRPKLKSSCILPVYPQRPGEKDCAHYMLTRTCRFGETCKFDHPIWVPDGGIPDWKEAVMLVVALGVVECSWRRCFRWWWSCGGVRVGEDPFGKLVEVLPYRWTKGAGAFGSIESMELSPLMQLPPIASEFHPERPGEPDCPHFVKTQKCKFGLNCKFNHPQDILCTSGKTDAADLPERPSEPPCSFYVKTGKCKFGATCKFHHPKDIQISSNEQEASDGEQDKLVGNQNCINDKNEVKTFISDAAPSFNSKGLPVRLGEEDCPFYLKTGSCKYAANCRYNHPDRNAISPLATVGSHSALASTIPSLAAASILQSFQPSLAQAMVGLGPVSYPQRPGQTECDFYMKTGVCKYGESCKFHHPIDRSAPVKFTLAGLPRREGTANCAFYMKTGTCRFGATCKYDHPPPGEVATSAEKENAAIDEEAKENEETEENVESTGE
ncbi:hypothetical protein KSS87_010635 [Heliosperma pusillum]|nr:hypothetical protein KSS87_010635 [Heliosperma pusillum]